MLGVASAKGSALNVQQLVGHRIREVRERESITQEQLGRDLGPLLGREWARQAVSTAERGERAFTATELVAIAYVLGTSVGWLLTPPVSHREGVELPGGQMIDRPQMVRAATSSASSQQVFLEMHETIRNLSEGALTIHHSNDRVLIAVETLLVQLERAAIKADRQEEGERVEEVSQ